MLALDSWRRSFQFRLAPTRWFARALLSTGLFFGLLMHGVQANASKNTRVLQPAAAFEVAQLPKVPGLPSVTGPSADWRQFDSFFTFVVKRFSDDVPATLKDSLGDAFLDSRYELTSAIAPGKGGNPVPELFINGWKGLSPVMNQPLPALPKQTASLHSSFIGAADKLAYNGGPSALGRYRGVRQSPTWKKVDEAFWEKFKVVSAGNEMAVKSCYEK
jgi:hypothetical protein